MCMAVISSIPRIGASGTRKPCWKDRSIRNARFAALKRRMKSLRTDKGTRNHNALSPWPFPDQPRCPTLIRHARQIGVAHGTRLISTRPWLSTAAADALDLAVERGVLFVDWIVWIAQVLLRRHLIGARLAVADRGFAKRLGLVCSARRSGFATRLRHRGGTANQDQQRH